MADRQEDMNGFCLTGYSGMDNRTIFLPLCETMLLSGKIEGAHDCLI